MPLNANHRRILSALDTLGPMPIGIATRAGGREALQDLHDANLVWTCRGSVRVNPRASRAA